ncbi:Hypothetical Protein RRSL_02021 [Ralstonia solanacearum UW551]|uniref:Uncharacterized protein n=1 Tax=Ralstonia solanacearum (strain UW551) TaxID=342110 RepID=A0AB33VAH0_RALSU|nr:Hypothetical Protein RRSL_02021 [Ralstonia solanacearum UW551]
MQRLHRCADVARRCHAVRSCYCAPRECVAGPRGGRWPGAHCARLDLPIASRPSKADSKEPLIKCRRTRPALPGAAPGHLIRGSVTARKRLLT